MGIGKEAAGANYFHGCIIVLSQSFKDSCLKFYEAELEELDFQGATEESRQHINTWVAKKTEGEQSFSVLFVFSARI